MCLSLGRCRSEAPVVLDRNASPLRLYQQVADRIVALIEKGEVKAGQKLPPERDLATRFKISRPVVREALVSLELSGAIEVRTGSGASRKSAPCKRGCLAASAEPFPLSESRWRGTHWETLEAARAFHLAIARAARNDTLFAV